MQVFVFERWARGRWVERVSPYLHGLLGMAGWTYYDEGLRSGAFGPVLLLGTGVDVRLWPWLALRAEAETSIPHIGIWLWRFSCGLVFRFGGTEPYVAQR